MCPLPVQYYVIYEELEYITDNQQTRHLVWNSITFAYRSQIVHLNSAETHGYIWKKSSIGYRLSDARY